MIWKLLAVSFLLSLIYTIYKIPSYDDPISDSIFNFLGLLFPIFLVLFVLNLAVSKSMKLEVPFEKAFNLTISILNFSQKIYIYMVALSGLGSVLIGLMFLGLIKITISDIGAQWILAMMPGVFPIAIILTILLHLDIKLLKKKSKIGYFLAYFISLIPVFPPLIGALPIYWFLIKYRKEYFAIVEKDQQTSSPLSDSSNLTASKFLE